MDNHAYNHYLWECHIDFLFVGGLRIVVAEEIPLKMKSASEALHYISYGKQRVERKLESLPYI